MTACARKPRYCGNPDGQVTYQTFEPCRIAGSQGLRVAISAPQCHDTVVTAISTTTSTGSFTAARDPAGTRAVDREDFLYRENTRTCATVPQFVFNSSEQDFMRSVVHRPRRCPTTEPPKAAPSRWRRYRRVGAAAVRRSGCYSSGGGDSSVAAYDRGPREMFAATCSNCGNEARVPFRPTSGKPVYCSDCFRTMRG